MELLVIGHEHRAPTRELCLSASEPQSTLIRLRLLHWEGAGVKKQFLKNRRWLGSLYSSNPKEVSPKSSLAPLLAASEMTIFGNVRS